MHKLRVPPKKTFPTYDADRLRLCEGGVTREQYTDWVTSLVRLNLIKNSNAGKIIRHASPFLADGGVDAIVITNQSQMETRLDASNGWGSFFPIKLTDDIFALRDKLNALKRTFGDTENGWYGSSVAKLLLYQLYRLKLWFPPATPNPVESSNDQTDAPTDAPTDATPSKEESDDDGLTMDFVATTQSSSQPGQVSTKQEEPATKKSKTDVAKVEAVEEEDELEKLFEDEVALFDDRAKMKACRKIVDSFVDRLEAEGTKQGCDMYANVQSVCIGDIPRYANMYEEVFTGRLQKIIDKDFAAMSDKAYAEGALNGLERFYRKNPKGSGYIPIYVPDKKHAGGMQRLGAIDHIIPQAYSIFHHPRVYCMVHTRLNSHMRDNHPEYRIAAGLTRAQIVKVQNFVKLFRSRPYARESMLRFYKELPPVESVVSMRGMGRL